MRDPGQYPAGRDSADPPVLRYGSWAEMPVVPLTGGPQKVYGNKSPFLEGPFRWGRGQTSYSLHAVADLMLQVLVAEIAGAADVQSSSNSGFCHLCAAWPEPNDSSSRSLHRRYCTIRSSHSPISRQSVCRIDGASVSQCAIGHQPTPESLHQANERLKSQFSATMARAKRYDAQGNRSGCTRALNAAKQMYIP
jgi:hypothetical protein